MSSVFWVHEDSIRAPLDPLIPSLFVFDPAFTQTVSLKRILFVYESLLDLPVEIQKGDPVILIEEFALRHNADEVTTNFTPDPRLSAIVRKLQARLRVTVVESEPFVITPATLDLKRFSRYWAKVKEAAMRVD